MTYIDLHALDCIDDRIAKALATKEDTLAAFRKQVDKVKTTHKHNLIELVKSL